MAPEIILALLSQLMQNARGAYIVTLGVLAANAIVWFTNPRAHGNKSWSQIAQFAVTSCWPMYVFCAVLPVSTSFAACLACFNVWIVLCVSAPEDRRMLEMVLQIMWLLPIGAIVMMATLLDFKNVHPPVAIHPLIFLDVAQVCLLNMLRVLPVLISIGLASVLTYFTNPPLHRIVFVPCGEYTVVQAFLEPLHLDYLGLVCVIYSIIFPIPWEISLFVSGGIILIPSLVAIADYLGKNKMLVGCTEDLAGNKERVDIEFYLMYVCNAFALALYLFKNIF